MRPYATAADLTAWLPSGSEVVDADRLILRATEVVAEHVTTGYALDTAGDPAVTEVAAALRDATVAQVEQWLEVGEENDVAGYPRTTAMSSSGMNLSALPAILAPRARRILRLAGLTGAVIY